MAANSDFPTAPLSAYQYHMLEGDWPLTHWFSDFIVDNGTLNKIKLLSNGIDITHGKDYLSLGQFLIETSLLEPHPVQRPATYANVENLKGKFAREGIRRPENVGVVIGLGDGWYKMNKKTPESIKISNSSPHIPLLSRTGTNIIGQVIRGGHRTEAIKRFSDQSGHPEENFWIYEVFIPGMLC